MCYFKWLTAIFLVAGFAGCVSTGKNFEIDKVRAIEKGITTKTEIGQWFGYPYMTGLDDGDETWIYNHSKTSGGTTNTKNLYIIFTNEGIVKSFTFSTSFPEEISVKPR